MQLNAAKFCVFLEHMCEVSHLQVFELMFPHSTGAQFSSMTFELNEISPWSRLTKETLQNARFRSHFGSLQGGGSQLAGPQNGPQIGPQLDLKLDLKMELVQHKTTQK